MLVALRLRLYKATKLQPKANPSQYLASLFASLLRLLFDVSWRVTSDEGTSSSPSLPQTSSPVLAQHITPLTVPIQMLRNRLGNSIAPKKHAQVLKKTPNSVVCFLNLVPSPIIIQGVAPTKAVSAHGKKTHGKKTGKSCWARTPKARTALNQKRDTQKCTPSAAALLHFEIKLKHQDISLSADSLWAFPRQLQCFPSIQKN